MKGKTPKPKAFKQRVRLLDGETAVATADVLMVPTYADAATAFYSGQLVRDGVVLATLSAAGPISGFPAAGPIGRPTATAKHYATQLAWAVERQRLGGDGRADEAIVSLGWYSDAKKVRDIRNGLKGVPAVPRDVIAFAVPSGDLGHAALIEKPTIYFDRPAMTIVGHAWLWREDWRAVAVECVVKFDATVRECSPFRAMQASGGPVILVGF